MDKKIRIYEFFLEHGKVECGNGRILRKTRKKGRWIISDVIIFQNEIILGQSLIFVAAQTNFSTHCAARVNFFKRFKMRYPNG